MPTNIKSVTDDLFTAFRKSAHEHWAMFVTEGVILVLLGLAAVIFPPIAGLAATILIGWLFLIAGVAGLFFSLKARQKPGFVWSLLSAILAIIAGVVLLWNPFRGLATLTYVLIAFFIVDGVFMIALAIEHRRELAGRWEWMVVNGVIDLILAAIIISGFPGSFIWAFGLIVGIDMLFGGASLIAMGLDARGAAT